MTSKFLVRLLSNVGDLDTPVKHRNTKRLDDQDHNDSAPLLEQYRRARPAVGAIDGEKKLRIGEHDRTQYNSRMRTGCVLCRVLKRESTTAERYGCGEWGRASVVISPGEEKRGFSHSADGGSLSARHQECTGRSRLFPPSSQNRRSRTLQSHRPARPTRGIVGRGPVPTFVFTGGRTSLRHPQRRHLSRHLSDRPIFVFPLPQLCQHSDLTVGVALRDLVHQVG